MPSWLAAGRSISSTTASRTCRRFKGMITRLCPKARVGVGHGKMPAEQLEKLIMDFIYGEFDVLISTTIVENGIDIPNANTIIVNNAQNFGLSDLHQLRGRVGRRTSKGYCYLLSPPRRAADVRCPAAPAGHRGVLRPGFGIQHRHAGPRHSRARATCWAPSRAASSPTSVSKPTRRSCSEAVAELRARRDSMMPGHERRASRSVVDKMRYISDTR